MLTREELRRRHGKIWTALRNMLRRVAVVSTGILEWKLEGFVDEEGNVEAERAEVFGVAGFASRPRSKSKAEAILAYLGGRPNAPVIVATRDADAAQAFEAAAGELGKGETAIYTQSGAYVKIDKDGNVFVSPSPTGVVRMARGAAIAATLVPGINGMVTGLDVDAFGIPFGMRGGGSQVVVGSKT